MNLIKCNYGHFYDADRFATCPHCAEGNVMSPTIPAEDTAFGTTVMDTSNVILPTEPLTETTTTVDDSVDDQPSDIQKTVGFFEGDLGLEPVVGWLVCIEGSHIGKDFRLVSGRNFIGRSTKNDVVLEGDATVSRDSHAVVVYEPKGNVYLIQPGASKELSYLNDQVVLESKVINVNDVIQVGATKLMFIPCCSDKFVWTDTKKED